MGDDGWYSLILIDYKKIEEHIALWRRGDGAAGPEERPSNRGKSMTRAISRRRKLSATATLGSVSLFAALVPAAASAQRGVAALPAAEGVATLGEVIVTAQRREERLQDVPIAVTALTGEQIQNQRIESLQDVSRVTPGLLVSAFNYSSPTIAIRGANNTFTQVGVNRPVGLVVDDVVVSRASAMVFELVDLQSVQVLRGPQGTLFGRNVTGGAIVLTTRKPSFSSPEALGSVSYGNYGAFGLNALVGGPLGENLAAKVVVSFADQDGFGFDRLTGKEQDNPHSFSGRGQLRFRHGIADSLFSLGFSSDGNGGRTLSSLGVGDDFNRRSSELGVDQGFNRRIWSLSNRTDFDLGEAGTLTSVAAYLSSRAGERYSQTGVNYAFLTAGNQQVLDDRDRVEDLSYELRYASPAWGWGNFIAGLYYLDEDAARQLRTQNLAARTGVLVGNQLADQKVTTESIAGFVDGSVNLPANLKLSLGGRYTYEKKRARLVRSNFINPAAGFDTGELDESWKQFTPRAVLSWSPSPDVMLYASYSRGFTSGGFNTDANNIASIVNPFAPEKVINKEVGAKVSMFDRRATLNMAAFDMKYTDKQEFVFDTRTAIGTILNAARASSRGFEIEVGLHPLSGLDLNFTYGYLDTSYGRFEIAGVVNNTGHPLGSSPPHRFSSTLNYERELGGAGFLNTNISYAWTDDYYTGATKDPNLFVRSYSLVNASLAYQTIDRRYRVAVWGKNLADTEYLLTPATVGVRSEYLGRPRTYGVTFTATY